MRTSTSCAMSWPTSSASGTPRAYGDVMIETAGPARMRHLEQRLALDDHMAALVQKAREKMAEPSRG